MRAAYVVSLPKRVKETSVSTAVPLAIGNPVALGIWAEVFQTCIDPGQVRNHCLMMSSSCIEPCISAFAVQLSNYRQ